MNINQHAPKEAKKIKSIYWVVFGLVAFLLFGGFYYVTQAKKNEANITYLLPQNKLAVLGQTDTKNSGKEKEPTNFSSENFKVSQVTVSDITENVGVIDFEESKILQIKEPKSELYSVKEGEKENVKAIISCNTTKRSNVSVEYFKSGEKNGTTVKDTYFGLGHTLIISGLDPDSVYKYSIQADDLMGNNVNSEQFVFYTGAPNVSLMTVLENATQKVFGWAIKK